jgi:hypothetical protein
VESTPHSLIASEAEGNVGDTTADLGAWAHPLDLTGSPDEVDCVVVVLCHASANGQDVGVKDDVLRVEADLLDQDAVGTLANAHLSLAPQGSVQKVYVYCCLVC